MKQNVISNKRSNTTLKIITVDEKSPCLEKVINLGRANATTLGFLPKGAFVKYATDNQILVALGDDEKVLGYLLYGVSQRKRQVYIVHLCIDQSHRRQGIARMLFEGLKKATRDELYGVRVRCRHDYDASRLWPTLGFVVLGEMPGRSKQGSTLTIWWFDYEHPTLFSYAEQHQAQSKLKVAIDANVFFDLKDSPDSKNEESQSLLADWLQENVELCLTDEIFNEIFRNDNAQAREEGRTFASSFAKLSGPDNVFQTACEDLRQFFPKQMSTSDESDIRQLARTIASGTQFFVTRDDGLLGKNDLIYEQFGVRIIRPADLVINQDQLVRDAEYYPARLAGSQIKIERVHPGQSSSLVDIFRAPRAETKGKIRQNLHTFLSDPRTFETNVVQSVERLLALIVYSRQIQDELSIPMFRLGKGTLATTLARYLVLHSVLISSQERRVLTKVTDPYLSEIVIDALQEAGFVQANKVWIKANLPVVESSKELISRLATLGNKFPQSKLYFERIEQALATACSHNNAWAMLQVERSLWPAKIIDIDIPAFIVPIQPVWAMNLFDSSIARQDLFGGEPSLIFNAENVYYRARRPKILSAPSRVLWYVSKGKGKYQETMSVRACSYIDKVVIDKPKSLFSRFQRLGVYQWEDVFEIAKRDINQEIMAFQFSNTEIFNCPIHRDDLQKIWIKETGKGFHIQSPLSIPLQQFFYLYEKGVALVKE